MDMQFPKMSTGDPGERFLVTTTKRGYSCRIDLWLMLERHR
jgi:hypothetical protein